MPFWYDQAASAAPRRVCPTTSPAALTSCGIGLAPTVNVLGAPSVHSTTALLPLTPCSYEPTTYLPFGSTAATPDGVSAGRGEASRATSHLKPAGAVGLAWVGGLVSVVGGGPLGVGAVTGDAVAEAAVEVVTSAVRRSRRTTAVPTSASSTV